MAEVLPVLLFVGTASPSWAVPYVLETVQIEGLTSFELYDINDRGQLLGNARAGEVDLGGFVYDKTGITQLHFPGDVPIRPASINNLGQIVGIRLVPVDENRPGISTTGGFLFDGEFYHEFDVPGAGTTAIGDITDDGRIVGSYSAGTGLNEPRNGFIYENGIFTTFSVPGVSHTTISGINSNGDIVGAYGFPFWQAYRFDGVAVKDIDLLDAEIVAPSDINDDGVIVGAFRISFLNETPIAGFVVEDGQVEPIWYRDSVQTTISGINNAGEIVGTYIDTDGIHHGFIGRPVPEPRTIQLFAGAAGALTLLSLRSFPRARAHRA